MTAPKREMLHDIEPNPHPARAWHAATPPVCPECGCDHSYPAWADRDALRSLYAERDRALAKAERLRRAYKAHECMPCNVCGDWSEVDLARIDEERAAIDALHPTDLDEVQP